MKLQLKRTITSSLAVFALVGGAFQSRSDVTVEVDPGANWQAFMNVFELPANGGGYVFGSGWGIPDLTAEFTPGVLTLGPNTIGDPDPFWYQGGGGPGAPGNKTMDANLYVEETDTLSGMKVTFSGTVLANTLTSAHTSVAFIKDFAPDYSSSISVSVPLTPGPFSVDLDTLADPGRHVQFGFETIGENVWVTDVGPFGTVMIATVPEPATFALAGMGVAALLILRRRR